MAKKFKDYYDQECVNIHIQKFRENNVDIDTDKYRKYIIPNINGKEFMERQEIFANALKNSLNIGYEESLKQLTYFLGKELQKDTGMFTEGWWIWPISKYIELFSLDYPESIDKTMCFIEEMTKRFTGEFAIRGILQNHTDVGLKKVLEWSKSDNVHVKRLSSEGIRVKLPWAQKLDVFLNNFDRCYMVLDNLKEDDSKFVQKSVANNINDLFKVKPEYAKVFVDQWGKSDNKNTKWILKHGQRWWNKKNS